MSRECLLDVGRWMLRVGIEWSWPWGMVECKGGRYSFCGWRTACLYEGAVRVMSTLLVIGPLYIGWARRVA